MSITALPIHGLEQYTRMHGGQPSPSHSAAAVAAAASMFLNSSGPLPSYMSSPANTNAAAAAAGLSNGSGAVESPLPFCHGVWEDAAPGSLAARLLSSSTEELFDVAGDDGIPLEDACGEATLRQSSDPHHHPSPFGSDDLQSWKAIDADQAAPVMSGKLARLASLQSQHFQASVESQQMSGLPLQRLLSQSSIGSNCSGPFHHAALAVQLHSESFSVDGGASSDGPAGGPDGHSTTPTGLAAYLLSAPLEALFDVPEEEDPAALSAAGAGPDGDPSASGLRLDLHAIQRGETPPLPPQHPSGMFSPDPSSSAASAAAAETYVNYPGPIFSAPLGAVPARPKGHRHGSANGLPRHIKRVLSCNDAPPDQGVQGAYGTSTVFPNAQESYYAGSPRRGTAAAAVDTAGATSASGVVVRSRSTNSVENGPVAPVGCAGASSGWFRASGSLAGGTSSARQIAVAPSSQSSRKYGYTSQQNQLSSQRLVPGGSCADSDSCSASSGAGCASFLRPNTGSASSSTGSDNSSGSDSGSNVSPWQMVGAAAGTGSGSESYDEVSPHSASFARHKTTGSVEFARSRSGNYGGAPMLSPQHQQQVMHMQLGGASFGSSTGNGHFSAMCGGGGGFSAGGSGAGGGGPGAQGGSGTDRWVSPMGPVLTPIEQSPVTSDRYNPSAAAIAIANGSVSSSSQRSTPVASAVFARVSGGGADAGCSSPATVTELTPQERMLQQQLQQQMAMMMMMEGSVAAAVSSALQPLQSKERSMVKASSCNQLHMPQQQRQPQLTFGGMPYHHVHNPSHRHQRHLSGNSPSDSVPGAGGAGPAGPGSVISEADLRGLEEEMRQLEEDMARLQANPARLAQLSAQDKQRVQAAAAEIGSMRACLARRSPSTATNMFDASPGARPVVGGSYHGGAGAGLALGIGGGKKGGVFVAGDVDDM